MKSYNKIIKFWFSDESITNWFIADSKFDQTIKIKFLQRYKSILKATQSEDSLNPHECLALIIIISIMPKKMFRNTTKAFEHNNYAKLITNKILEKSMDSGFENKEKIFAYMPLVYSENIADQDLAIELYKKLNCSQISKQIKMNRDIIEEYGRLPQRNVILGRKSLESEKIVLTNVYPTMLPEYKLDLFL